MGEEGRAEAVSKLTASHRALSAVVLQVRTNSNQQVRPLHGDAG